MTVEKRDISPVMDKSASAALLPNTVEIVGIEAVEEIGPEDPRTPLDLVRSGRTIKQINVQVPLEDVLIEDTITYDSHVASMQHSLTQRLGQKGSVIYRAREMEERVVYDIIDGAHRSKGKKNNGDKTIRSDVFYNITDEEMYDGMIEASTVPEVQFSRIAEWVAKEWEQTEWSKQGITALQAFSLTAADRSKSYIADSSDTLAAIKNWAINKCKRWDRTAQYIRKILKIVDSADPELVKEVRKSKAGRGEIIVLTPSRLEAIVDHFPGRENYFIQRKIADAVVEHRLGADEVSQFALELSSRLNEEMTDAEISEVVDSSIQVFSALPVGKRIKDDEEEDEALFDETTDRFDFVRDTKVNDPQISLEKLLSRASTSTTMLRREATVGRVLTPGKVTDIEKKKRKRSNGWWVDTDYLTEREEDIMCMVFNEGVDLDRLEEEFGTTANEVLDTIMKVLVKKLQNRIENSESVSKQTAKVT